MAYVPEKCILCTSRAERLAKKYRRTAKSDPAPDPFDHIPHSLLAAEHIEKYVLETGLISPFYIRDGKRSRLKKAAYEGRMGNSAYLYEDDHNPKRVLFPESKFLLVPANSIVYIECDLEFRLPEFIALRFNLQIRHVHRGLLLGTGPLVDPGFWGKLCIPLHNLTDQPYRIPRNEGLIWFEFTKTTSNTQKNSETTGRPPMASEKEPKEFWDITDFLSKASKQFYPESPVPLRSSLPEVFEAAEKAKKAGDSVGFIKNISIAAGLGVAFGMLALWTTFFLETRDYQKEFAPISESVTDLGRFQNNIQLEVKNLRDGYKRKIQEIEENLQKLEAKNLYFKEQIEEFMSNQR